MTQAAAEPPEPDPVDDPEPEELVVGDALAEVPPDGVELLPPVGVELAEPEADGDFDGWTGEVLCVGGTVPVVAPLLGWAGLLPVAAGVD